MDTVARFGGDEFVIVLHNIGCRENAEKISQSILSAIQKPIRHSKYQLKIDASIGISMFPDDADNNNRLITLADQAMYRKKHGS